MIMLPTTDVFMNRNHSVTLTKVSLFNFGKKNKEYILPLIYNVFVHPRNYFLNLMVSLTKHVKYGTSVFNVEEQLPLAKKGVSISKFFLHSRPRPRVIGQMAEIKSSLL